MTRFYSTEHGTYEERGEPVITSVCGTGVLPPGSYNVLLASVVRQDNGSHSLIFLDEARGGHVETIENAPDWLIPEQRYTITIALAQGCYLRKAANGEMAIYDAATQERLSPFVKNIYPHLKGRTLAVPRLVAIQHKEHCWRLSDALSLPDT
jgi:hypothetical protein